MRKMIFAVAGALAVLVLFSAACGGGDDNTATTTAGGTKTPAAATKTAAATPAATKTAAATPAPSAAGSPASAAELKDAMTSIKAVLANTIAKAQAGDVQGTRDAEGEGDKAMETVIKAVRLVNPTLADGIEKLELDYEAQADSTTTDLTVMIKDAQDALKLLDQAATTLHITP